VVNAHLSTEHHDAQVRALLEDHHRQLCDALRAALETAYEQGQLAPRIAPGTAAESLALLAYGVNTRSRTGADAATLLRTVTDTLALLGA
jgi:hypothetical protein